MIPLLRANIHNSHVGVLQRRRTRTSAAFPGEDKTHFACWHCPICSPTTTSLLVIEEMEMRCFYPNLLTGAQWRTLEGVVLSGQNCALENRYIRKHSRRSTCGSYRLDTRTYSPSCVMISLRPALIFSLLVHPISCPNHCKSLAYSSAPVRLEWKKRNIWNCSIFSTPEVERRLKTIVQTRSGVVRWITAGKDE